MIDYTKPLFIDEIPAYYVGSETWGGDEVFFVSSGLPPSTYVFNVLGSPIDDPYFTDQGYAVTTDFLVNGEPECECPVPNPDIPPEIPFYKEMYLVQWDYAYTLESLNDIRFGVDALKMLPQSITKLGISLDPITGIVSGVTTEAMDVLELVGMYYAPSCKPITPESGFYNDSAIYG